MRAVAVLLFALLLPFAVQATTLNRDRGPVVLVGLDLPSFAGLAVDRLAAFRYQDEWIQIPVQVDERATVTFNQVYGGGFPQADIDVETYTDPDTYVGADADPLFDDNDELVFMATDAGERVAYARDLPAGLVAGSGLEVAVTDPIDGGVGYVYLFETDGTLDPSAGASYGTYTFDLLAGSYPDDYNLVSGPNPEDSGITSSTGEDRTSSPRCASTRSPV